MSNNKNNRVAIIKEKIKKLTILMKKATSDLKVAIKQEVNKKATELKAKAAKKLNNKKIIKKPTKLAKVTEKGSE